MTTISQAQPTTWPALRELLRGRVVRGSAILLLSNGMVAATNLVYNILLARMLGASGFGHVSALYTLLMLITAITFSFQIVTSKFIARNSDPTSRAEIYATLLRRSWKVGLGVGLLVAVGSSLLQTSLNLPAQHDLVLLAIGAAAYVPLGVRRGRMQGCYEFGSLAINVLVEVAVKFIAAVLFLHYGLGVTGVTIAMTLSIAAAYIVGKPGADYPSKAGSIRIGPFGEGLQAVLYFVGQVILTNVDVLLVKHFFPPSEAGIYAAVALVGRVLFVMSWSVVSSMFPVAAARGPQQREGRSVLYTGLLLVGGITSTFIAGVALAPHAIWTMLLGKAFLLSEAGRFPILLTEYSALTAIYCLAVVVMMYEISQRIGTAAWVQLGTSVILAVAIWFSHNSLSQVIRVQAIVMTALLLVVGVPLFRRGQEAAADVPSLLSFRKLRRVQEEEIVAEFLRGEFYHPVYHPYRSSFAHLVDQGTFANDKENSIRRALLYLRRGRLWRELPPGTEWWEIELSPGDLAQLQSFPRNDWRRFVGRSWNLKELVARIKAERFSGRSRMNLQKLDGIAKDLAENNVPDAVLLIGIDDQHPLTIIEGNHRTIAAMLTMPDLAHQKLRFFCGLSPNMDSCCWYETNPRSVTRYVRHTLRDILDGSEVRLRSGILRQSGIDLS